MVGLISVLAMGTILAKDHGNGNGGGNGGGGNPAPTVDANNNGNNGNHHGGGNNGAGNGNGGGNGNNGGVEQPAQVQSTPAPTASDGLLGCQKNNPSRLDCSSLDVSGSCQDGVAVFTIHNSGEAGDGDMRAPTEYRLVVDGVVVESGSIQLTGGSSTQITYSGGGSVTLEADQQVGHPGNSHPRVTLDCGPAEETSTPTPTEEPTQEVTPTATVEAPVLTGESFCKEDGSILFVVTNSGGDMLDSAPYTVSDENGMQIDSGSIQLLAGEQSGLQYWGYTSLTLVVGDLVVIASPTCVPATQEVTPDAPVLTVASDCMSDGSITFIIFNNGGDMPEPVYYSVTDSNGALVADGYIQLLSGEQFPLNYSGYPSFTLTVGDLVITSPDCAPSTPEPTQEVTPPVLNGEVSCMDDGSITFIITNTGGDMLDSDYYTVNTPDGGFVADGWLQLFTNEQARLQYWGYAQLTFTMGDLTVTQDSECPQPTPVPTEEVTPTPEPTQEVTPTSEPTQEVTPTAEPTDEVTPTATPTETVTVTPTPTDTGTLGCQKNNPGRLDCSSLQVSGTCQDGVAVFTIRNMGKRGEGDMVAPTEYRIIVDGGVVESGTVQLIGGAATQITYSGGGTVTLEADQQAGHPGKSQPQATVSCSA
ncbi:MAG: hypothetical protein ABI690_21500 [Chloroflexota bacterium]